MRDRLAQRMAQLAERGGPASGAFARIADIESKNEPPPPPQDLPTDHQDGADEVGRQDNQSDFRP